MHAGNTFTCLSVSQYRTMSASDCQAVRDKTSSLCARINNIVPTRRSIRCVTGNMAEIGGISEVVLTRNKAGKL